MDNRKIIPYLLSCIVAVVVLMMIYTAGVAGYWNQQQQKSLAAKAEALQESVPVVVVDYKLTKADLGKSLFKNNCAACHNKDMKSKMTGPPLSGVAERWSKYPRTDLYRWIRQSQSMIREKHPKALELWKEWKPTVMNDFRHLSDEDIEMILAYIEGV